MIFTEIQHMEDGYWVVSEHGDKLSGPWATHREALEEQDKVICMLRMSEAKQEAGEEW